MGNYHEWGDDFDFEAVGNAAEEIGDYCRKWGRIPVRQTKEKYGTVRVYSGFGIENLYWFFRPGWIYYRPPIWVRKLDDATFGKLFALLAKPIFKWQKFIYNKAYQKAVNKYPHIREEILTDADWPEYIDGNDDIMEENWRTTDDNGNSVKWSKRKTDDS